MPARLHTGCSVLSSIYICKPSCGSLKPWVRVPADFRAHRAGGRRSCSRVLDRAKAYALAERRVHHLEELPPSMASVSQRDTAWRPKLWTWCRYRPNAFLSFHCRCPFSINCSGCHRLLALSVRARQYALITVSSSVQPILHTPLNQTINTTPLSNALHCIEPLFSPHYTV